MVAASSGHKHHTHAAEHGPPTEAPGVACSPMSLADTVLLHATSRRFLRSRINCVLCCPRKVCNGAAKLREGKCPESNQARKGGRAPAAECSLSRGLILGHQYSRTYPPSCTVPRKRVCSVSIELNVGLSTPKASFCPFC